MAGVVGACGGAIPPATFFALGGSAVLAAAALPFLLGRRPAPQAAPAA